MYFVFLSRILGIRGLYISQKYPPLFPKRATTRGVFLLSFSDPKFFAPAARLLQRIMCNSMVMNTFCMIMRRRRENFALLDSENSDFYSKINRKPCSKPQNFRLRRHHQIQSPRGAKQGGNFCQGGIFCEDML